MRATRGIRRVLADADIVICPIADGSEGTVEALASAEMQCRVDGPYGESVLSDYLILPGLAHYAGIVRNSHPDAAPDAPGTGAAGGIGFALKTFCHAELQCGLQIIAQMLNLEEKIQSADYIITSEGKIDAQTMMGKVPAGIASLAKKYQKPVIVIAGAVADDIHRIYSLGIDAMFPIIKRPCTLAESMKPQIAQNNLSDTTEQIARLIYLSNRI